MHTGSRMQTAGVWLLLCMAEEVTCAGHLCAALAPSLPSHSTRNWRCLFLWAPGQTTSPGVGVGVGGWEGTGCVCVWYRAFVAVTESRKSLLDWTVSPSCPVCGQNPCPSGGSVHRAWANVFPPWSIREADDKKRISFHEVSPCSRLIFTGATAPCHLTPM